MLFNNKKICCMKQIQAHLFEFNKHTHRLNSVARVLQKNEKRKQ